MSIRRTNIDRLNEARKSKVPTIGRGKPSNSSGAEGDISFRRLSDGFKLYIKANGRWHGVKVGESFDFIEKQLKETKSKVDRIKKYKLPNIYSTLGDLTLDADGDINLDAVLSGVSDGIGLKNAGTMFSAFQIHHSASWLYLYENGGASTTDHLSLSCAANGASTISTTDAAGTDANLTLDVDGAIHIDSEDGIVNFKNSGTNMATFSSNRLRIFNQTDTADYFNIEVGSSASTTISTIDDAGTDADLTLDVDGAIILDSTSGSFNFLDDGTLNHALTANRFTMFNTSNTSDYFRIQCNAEGASEISTFDADTSVAHLTIDVDGDITLDAASGNVYVKDNGGNYTPGSDYEIATKKYVDDNAGGTIKYWMDWYYYSANLATQNYFYAEKHHDEFGVSSTINTDLSSSGYSTTSLNNMWRWQRYARRIPYSGSVTKLMVHLESTGAAADSDVEVALWYVSPLTLDTAYASTANASCDHLGTITFDFSSASRNMTKELTSFNATSVTQGGWFFITLRKITSGDGSSFHCHPTVLWDGS